MEALSPDPDFRPSSATAWRSRLEATRPERRRGTSSTLPVTNGSGSATKKRWGFSLLPLVAVAGLFTVRLWMVTGEPAATVKAKPSLLTQNALAANDNSTTASVKVRSRLAGSLNFYHRDVA